MKIRFSAIYAEVDTSFSLSHLVLKDLQTKLTSLNRKIDFFTNLFPSDDYTLYFNISATRKNDSFEIKGPGIYKKQKQVDFTFHLPYREGIFPEGETLYVLKNLEICIGEVFKRYKVDCSGLDVIFSEVVHAVESEEVQARKLH